MGLLNAPLWSIQSLSENISNHYKHSLFKLLFATLGPQIGVGVKSTVQSGISGGGPIESTVQRPSPFWRCRVGWKLLYGSVRTRFGAGFLSIVLSGQSDLTVPHFVDKYLVKF